MLAHGADIQNSRYGGGARLVFDYSGSDASLLASIRSDLKNGVIKDTLAGDAFPAAAMLPSAISTTARRITIEPMLAGDADHDGTVNASDLATLGLKWKQTNQNGRRATSTMMAP